eukprot:1817269-Amphidinium_carterae.1
MMIFVARRVESVCQLQFATGRCRRTAARTRLQRRHHCTLKISTVSGATSVALRHAGLVTRPWSVGGQALVRLAGSSGFADH